MTKPKNLLKPPIKVRHQDLERSGESPYRSKCPVCPKGILLVQRDQETFRLEKGDHCILCGQAIIYTDIQSLRRMDEGN